MIVRTIERTSSPTPDDGLLGASGIGSGVLISPDGKVLTAAHVVQTADRVAVEFANGMSVPARVIASEVRADVALLQLQRVPPGAVAARLADSDSVQVGDDVFIIGAPYGLGHSLSVGHVSGRHDMRRIVRGVPVEVLQTDAAVNMGNSGGPMFNTNGGVVGIVSQILSQSGGFEGIGRRIVEGGEAPAVTATVLVRRRRVSAHRCACADVQHSSTGRTVDSARGGGRRVPRWTACKYDASEGR